MTYLRRSMCTLTFLFAGVGAYAQTTYSTMAPIEQYRLASKADEIALARSAAPPSISDDAEILTLGDRGYDTAERGKNGFRLHRRTCLGQRIRQCRILESQGQRAYLFQCGFGTFRASLLSSANRMGTGRRIQSRYARSNQSRDRRKKNHAAGDGAMCYMMSKNGYLSDANGHWHPHLMFFLPHTESAAWGANLPGVPMFGGWRRHRAHHCIHDAGAQLVRRNARPDNVTQITATAEPISRLPYRNRLVEPGHTVLLVRQRTERQ
jgi:hypothetical protein